MKTKSYLAILSLVFIFSVTPYTAKASGWTDLLDGWAANVLDGWAAIDGNGCLVHIHTQEYRLFGITWSTREVIDVVWCP